MDEQVTPEIVETAAQSESVETAAQLTEAELAEFNEYKKNKAHFQSVADKQTTELQKKLLEEQIRREQIERELESLKNPKPAEPPLIKPVKPIKPADYDPIDAVTKGTSSYAYEQSYRQYLEDMAEYNERLLAKKEEELSKKLSVFDQIEEQRKAEEQRLQFKAQFINDLQLEGLDQNSASEAFEFFTSKESANPKTLAQIWRLLKTSSEKQTYSAPMPPTGVTQSNQPNPREFTRNADKSWMYKVKK